MLHVLQLFFNKKNFKMAQIDNLGDFLSLGLRMPHEMLASCMTSYLVQPLPTCSGCYPIMHSL